MSDYSTYTQRFIDRFILERPVLVIVAILALVGFLGYHARDFRLDASAETLVMENDKDLDYARTVYARYGLQEFMIMTLTPRGDMLSDTTIRLIQTLKKELGQVRWVTSVTTILDVPLLESPPVELKALKDNIRTLTSKDVDRALAREELKNSPIYRNLLISPDLGTTALIINLENDIRYRELLNQRDALRAKIKSGNYTGEDTASLEAVSTQFTEYRDQVRQARHEDIAHIRSIMKDHADDGELFLGGVSMVADDMITFIKNDLKVFGLGVLLLLILTLTLIFRNPRWIILPLLCCAFSVISMMGLLGMFDWEVTVISSNFVSLQLIITMSLAIHLIVKYRELHAANPDWDQRALVLKTTCMMIKPCTYASLTTIAGFASLLFCNILPVITFGWMMSAGIVVSMIMTFLLFPALMMLMKKGTPPSPKVHAYDVTAITARFTTAHGTRIMVIALVLMVLSGVGISRLKVENSFIDYFKKTTEIYQGMKVIDQKLGGTTPLDVILTLADDRTPKEEIAPPEEEAEAGAFEDDMFDDFEEFNDAGDDEKYWFTAEKMNTVKEVHAYLESLDATGKVLSLATLLKVAEKFNNDTPLDNFQLALLYSEIPQDYKTMLLKPYVSVEDNQVRISIRIKDSMKGLQRDALLKQIKHDLTTKLGLEPDKVHLAGMLVLYNNMLQSLFQSQILTLGIVVAALGVMFLILFRSLKIALIAIAPSLLSIGCVLGFMGWVGMPLDMMTITIAAISVGIAVDDTIHYIHRFRQEFQKDGNYPATLKRCHGSIGHAMTYTSLTIIMGFSILSLSNFIPTIFFGILTGLAMLIALTGALTLLPQLIVFFRVMGKPS